LRNFLNYIETHNVFPEYTGNIISAKYLVEIAKFELVKNRKFPPAGRKRANIRKYSNLFPGFPGDFNKACSTYFGGHYHGLCSGCSDAGFDYHFTTCKAMTFLRRVHNQKFLAGRKVTETSFPAEVVGIIPRDNYGIMVIKRWLVKGGEADQVDLEYKDTEIHITLEKEILEFVYVYIPSVCGLMIGGCILRLCGVVSRMGCGIWIK
jgi:hypothetical protein